MYVKYVSLLPFLCIDHALFCTNLKGPSSELSIFHILGCYLNPSVYIVDYKFCKSFNRFYILSFIYTAVFQNFETSPEGCFKGIVMEIF